MRQRILRGVFLAVLASAIAAPVSAGELKLSMQDGRVTIMADNVPLRQILQEWARVGQTTILNIDKLSGPPVTLQLVNMTEREALDILLRTANGYIAAPRPTQVAGAAIFDRITIFVSSKAAPVQAASATPAATFQRPQLMPDDGDEPLGVQMPPQMINPVNANGGQQFPGLPQNIPPALQQQLQQNQQLQQMMNNQNLSAPAGSPLTAPRPGALPQVPPSIQNPYQPPIKPGGGGPDGDPQHL